ncbi:MAG: HAD-IIB family hydrolase [Pseudomonadota bacterium]
MESAASISGILFDVDDTITTNGKLTPEAYAAMASLKAAHLLVFAITGRPAGWCDHIARMWPVDGVVGENGAFYFRYDEGAKKMVRRFIVDDSAREKYRQRMKDVSRMILQAVPGSALASDQPYREADIAIDYCEDVPQLANTEISRIKLIMEREGLTAKISSIHVNGWIGQYDKLTTTQLMLEEAFGIDVEAEKSRFVFVGDSPNDQPMFAFFPNTVGVANVRDFTAQLTTPPAYITHARSGAGFVEVAEKLLACRLCVPENNR